MKPSELLNTSQKNHFLVTVRYADQLLNEVEQILHPAAQNPLFPKYVPDFGPQDAARISAAMVEFRRQMAEALETLGINSASVQIGALHAITTNLDYVEMELDNLTPQSMRGYGELSQEAADQLESAVRKLQSGLRQLLSSLPQRTGEFPRRSKKP
jgi:uncharacterized protein Yka (UPF0111/DUF47 family)